MRPSARGRPSKSSADTRSVDAAAAVDPPMCLDPYYGCRITPSPNAPAATRNSGWVVGSITVGVYLCIFQCCPISTAETNVFNVLFFLLVYFMAVCRVSVMCRCDRLKTGNTVLAGRYFALTAQNSGRRYLMKDSINRLDYAGLVIIV